MQENIATSLIKIHLVQLVFEKPSKYICELALSFLFHFCDNYKDLYVKRVMLIWWQFDIFCCCLNVMGYTEYKETNLHVYPVLWKRIQEQAKKIKYARKISLQLRGMVVNQVRVFVSEETSENLKQGLCLLFLELLSVKKLFNLWSKSPNPPKNKHCLVPMIFLLVSGKIETKQ